jgi:LPXTG-site transpeptidase (sortase) family protein
LYNVTLTDKLPDELKYIPGSLVYVSGVIPDTLDESDPKNLAAIWDSYDRGAGETILRYRVTVKSLKPSGIKNTAVLTWSSLPNNFLTAQTANNPLSTERYYDPNSTINIYGASSSFTLNEPRSLLPNDRNQYLSGKSAQSLPLTGFAPGKWTSLELQPNNKQYRSLGEIALDLPSLGIKTSVINVPFVDGTWDVKWLNSQAGYLEGTTFPTQKGNTVITAHVYNSDGGPGLFVNLSDLKWGDIIHLHAWGNDYAYEVRSNQQVKPNAISVLGSKKKGTWLTLLTCRGYNEVKNTYQWRIAVQAVLVKITPDQR